MQLSDSKLSKEEALDWIPNIEKKKKKSNLERKKNAHCVKSDVL